jgi:hypothetical protein
MVNLAIQKVASGVFTGTFQVAVTGRARLVLSEMDAPDQLRHVQVHAVLFEKEGDASRRALIPQGPRPLDVHQPGFGAAFATADDPIQFFT